MATWRDALKDGKNIITLVRVHYYHFVDAEVKTFWVSDARNGILHKKYNQKLSVSALGPLRPGPASLGGLGASITARANQREVFKPFLKSSIVHEMDEDGRSNFGQIELDNTTGEFNFLQFNRPAVTFGQNTLTGHPIEAFLGAEDDDLVDFEKVMDSVIESFSFSNGLQDLVISIQDLGLTLRSKKVQQNTYTGEGGIEGMEDLEGQSKPLLFGRVSTTTSSLMHIVASRPILIDENKLIWQINDGPTAPFVSTQQFVVMDRGVELTLDTDFDEDTDDIFNYTVTAGEFAVDLKKSLIRLGAVPQGEVTVDHPGINEVDGVDIALERTKGIVRGVFARAGISLDRLDLSGLDEFSDGRNYNMLIDCTDITVAEALDKLIRDSDTGMWFVDNLNKVKFAKYFNQRNTGGPQPNKGTFGKTEIIEVLEVSDSHTPYHMIVANARPVFFPQSKSELAPSLSAFEKRINSSEFITKFIARDDSMSIFMRNAYPASRKLELDTTIGRDTLSNFSNLALDKLHEFRNFRTKEIRFRMTPNNLFNIEPGDQLNIKFEYPTLDIEFGELHVLQVKTVQNNVEARYVEILGSATNNNTE